MSDSRDYTPDAAVIPLRLGDGTVIGEVNLFFHNDKPEAVAHIRFDNQLIAAAMRNMDQPDYTIDLPSTKPLIRRRTKS